MKQLFRIGCWAVQRRVITSCYKSGGKSNDAGDNSIPKIRATRCAFTSLWCAGVYDTQESDANGEKFVALVNQICGGPETLQILAAVLSKYLVITENELNIWKVRGDMSTIITFDGTQFVNSLALLAPCRLHFQAMA